ncbi:hypothetical protein V6Z12_A13G074300 [Gossypium hirsutum]
MELKRVYVNGMNEQGDFDPSSPPQFRIADIRAAIPKQCWIKNPWRSMSYVFRDVSVVFSLAAAAVYCNSYGHGSFSDNAILNSVVGHILHSSILVPYHGWRISHRTHHQNHGNVEKDESWVPLPENIYKKLDTSTPLLRFTVPFLLFAIPMYLWFRSPGKEGSHFNPYSNLFSPQERKLVMISNACWSPMVIILAYVSFTVGPSHVFKLYGIPYLEWSYLRGGLTTVDLDYGLFNNIHHDIGTHVIHHLFPQIPHYHLVEATKAAKPVIGNFYREPKKSGAVPFNLINNLITSLGQDHYVSNSGDI